MTPRSAGRHLTSVSIAESWLTVFSVRPDLPRYRALLCPSAYRIPETRQSARRARTFIVSFLRLYDLETCQLISISQISLSPTAQPQLTGNRATSARGKLLFSLLSPLAPLLPAPLKITVSDHDMGNWLLGADYLEAARQAIKRGKYLSPREISRYERREGWGKVKGMMGACAVGSKGWNVSLDRQNGVDVDGGQEGELCDRMSMVSHQPKAYCFSDVGTDQGAAMSCWGPFKDLLI